jgi:hypothetical protein
MARARWFGPNGPLGGAASTRLAQHRHAPSKSVTRVTSGLISEISCAHRLGELRLARHRRPAVLAMCAQDVAFVRRVGAQWPMRPGARLSLGLACLLARRLAPLRGRRTRIVWRLWRQVQSLAQRCVLVLQGQKPLAQFIDPRQQRHDQRVFHSTCKAAREQDRIDPVVEFAQPALTRNGVIELREPTQEMKMPPARGAKYLRNHRNPRSSHERSAASHP